MDASKQKEWEVAYEATLDTIRRTRGALALIVGVVCVGLFHFFLWYWSWDQARISGRRAVVAAVASMDETGKYYLGTKEKDQEYIERLELEIAELAQARASSRLKVTSLDIGVSGADISTAIQIVGVAAMAWFLFGQRRLNYSLRALQALGGWGVPLKLVELNFGFVGSHATRMMRVVGRALPLALPALSVLYVGSDIYDLLGFYQNNLTRLALYDVHYDIRIGVRLLVGLTLTGLLVVLGKQSYREWRATENELTRFATEAAGAQNGGSGENKKEKAEKERKKN